MVNGDEMAGSASGQTWNPERYARDAGFVAEFGRDVVALLAPRGGERILDLGCGDGVLTAALAAAGARVVGVDASAEQVAAARARFAASDAVDIQHMSGEMLTFANEFDAVFSNAALHWMRKPDAVICGVWNALRPGGRFVGEMGGAGNVAAIERALMQALDRRGLDAAAANPWYFPAPDDYRRRLEAAGFRVRMIDLFPRPTPLSTGFAPWLETFAGSFLSRVDPDDRRAVMDEVTEAVRPALCDQDGNWAADYVRLRFAADKPAEDQD